MKLSFKLSLLFIVTLAIAYFVYKYSREEQFNANVRYFFLDPFAASDSSIALGSSSIAKLDLALLESCGQWINRGIGKAQINDITSYLENSRLRAKPKRILIYAGENDIRYGKSLIQTIAEYKALVTRLSEEYKESEIHLIAIKLSPKRKEYWGDYLAFNRQIESWTLQSSKLYWHKHELAKLNDEKQIAKEYYQKDELHLSPKGYGEFIKGIKVSCQKN